ncbi:ABC transporter permease [Pokkaliibacter plantistimulans]|uniref:ABC transporter permease n=1 Tax=Proteobacteria bacterium 228 TaxID=2083153 RepID=A0A2S5KI10_9PROT|nr:ABC transporter permease [Pokkaliibacter plantistimulans]PPC74006.1 ABC transporter permease [Pokkaliibacter plantistimulans]
MRRLVWPAASFLFWLLLLAIWFVITQQKWVSPLFLPAPEKAFTALFNGLQSGTLLSATSSTVLRMLVGWLLASLLGIVLGAIIGSSPRIRPYLEPTLEFLRPLPASAMVPVFIAWLGLSESMVLAVIAFGAIWPMLLGTLYGFRSVEPRLYEVAEVLKLSRSKIIFSIALPSALPDILSGMKFGLTVALILAVVGEMLTSSEGLGRWILEAARAFQAPKLFAGVILLGLIGLVSSSFISFLEQHLLRWK